MIDLAIANYLNIPIPTACPCGTPITEEICPVCGTMTFQLPNFFNPELMNMAERRLSYSTEFFKYVTLLSLERNETPAFALIRATPEQRRRLFFETIKGNTGGSNAKAPI